MPYSGTYLDRPMRDWVLQNIPIGAVAIDVGPGAGKWGKLLRPWYVVDAIEIWEPFIEQFNLSSIYRSVYVGDVRDFDFSPYQLAVFGDVLEHLATEEAQRVLQNVFAAGCRALVQVPFQYEQGEMFGNPYEEHHQPDLTPEVMRARYPELAPLVTQGILGAYVL